MPVAHRRQAEGVVVRAYSSLPMRMRVVSSSRTTAASTFARGQAGELQVAFGGAADLRQRPAEGERPAVFRLVPDAPPSRVVTVLLPPPVVAARRLDVAVGSRADPDLGPGGRDRQRLDPRQGLGVADRMTLRVDVTIDGRASPGESPAVPSLTYRKPASCATVAGSGPGSASTGSRGVRPRARGIVAAVAIVESLEKRIPEGLSISRVAGLPSRHAWCSPQEIAPVVRRPRCRREVQRGPAAMARRETSR